MKNVYRKIQATLVPNFQESRHLEYLSWRTKYTHRSPEKEQTEVVRLTPPNDVTLDWCVTRCQLDDLQQHDQTIDMKITKTNLERRTHTLDWGARQTEVG